MMMGSFFANRLFVGPWCPKGPMLAGTCPASPAREGGVKGHNMNDNTLPGSPACKGGRLHNGKDEERYIEGQVLDLNLSSLTQILRDGNDTHKQGGMIFSNSYAMPYALCTMLFLGWRSFHSKEDAFRYCFLPTVSSPKLQRRRAF